MWELKCSLKLGVIMETGIWGVEPPLAQLFHWHGKLTLFISQGSRCNINYNYTSRTDIQETET